MAEEFRDRDLRDALFVECDLSRARFRGVEVSGLDIDAPWLWAGAGLFVNGVDVTAFVEEELNRRFPGRAQWRATDPNGLREAWRSIEGAWDAALARAASLPVGTADERVDGEWSFAETLRHLVHATDLWVGRSVLGWSDDAFHPLGLGHAQAGGDPAPYAEVLAARAERVALVRDLLGDATQEWLDEERRSPHDADRVVSVRHCLQVIMEESWEHLRFALRDLDTLQRA